MSAADRPRAHLVAHDPSKFGLPSAPIRDAAHARNVIEIAAGQGCIVLGTAVTQIQGLPPNHELSIRVVTIDTALGVEVGRDGKSYPQTSNGTVYKVDGKLALHRSALDQLAAAAGISWVPTQCVRTDDGKAPLLWSWRMTARRKLLDGTIATFPRDKTVDLRDGSPEARAMASDKQLAGARMHGSALAQSKAANRAIRAALGLRGAYTADELSRPIVIPALTYVPPDTPEVRLLQAAMEFDVVESVFGPRSGRAMMAIMDGGPELEILTADPTDEEPAPAAVAATAADPWDVPTPVPAWPPQGFTDATCRDLAGFMAVNRSGPARDAMRALAEKPTAEWGAAQGRFVAHIATEQGVLEVERWRAAVRGGA